MNYRGYKIVPEPPKTLFGGWSVSIYKDDRLMCWMEAQADEEESFEDAKHQIDRWVTGEWQYGDEE